MFKRYTKYIEDDGDAVFAYDLGALGLEVIITVGTIYFSFISNGRPRFSIHGRAADTLSGVSDQFTGSELRGVRKSPPMYNNNNKYYPNAANIIIL